MRGAFARGGIEPVKAAIRSTGSGLVVQVCSVAASLGGLAGAAAWAGVVATLPARRNALTMRIRPMGA